MEFLLQQAFTTILISVLVEIVVVNNLPKWRKKEQDEKQSAIAEKKVCLSGMLRKQWTALMLVLIACGILFTLFPSWLLNWIGIDHKIVLLIFWGYALFLIIINLPKLTKYEYDEHSFKRINAFGFSKTFQYEDVVEVIETKTAYKIITKIKKIRFGRGLCGADNFIIYLKKKCNLG